LPAMIASLAIFGFANTPRRTTAAGFSIANHANSVSYPCKEQKPASGAVAVRVATIHSLIDLGEVHLLMSVVTAGQGPFYTPSAFGQREIGFDSSHPI